MQAPEALGTTEDDARGHAMAPVQAHQLIAEQTVFGAVALAEVCGQFEAVLVHSANPIVRPSRAAAKPSTRLSSPLITAADICPSSARR